MTTNTSEIAGIIICIREGKLYDNNYTKYKPLSKNGKIIIHVINYNDLQLFLSDEPPTQANSYVEEEQEEQLDEHNKNNKNNKNNNAIFNYICDIKNDIVKIHPSKVSFNFECCSGININPITYIYSFINKDITMKFIYQMLFNGHMVICADFSLKALINCWIPELGICPFIRIGSCSGKIKLVFDKETLLNAPSAQLNKVAELAINQNIIVECQSRTIVYSINNDFKNAKNQPYNKLTILTTVSKNINSIQQNNNNASNICGHCMLHYNTGGILLTSNCHFADLSKIETTFDTLIISIEKQHGTKCNLAQELITSYKSATSENDKNNILTNISSALICTTSSTQDEPTNNIYNTLEE